MPLFDLSLLHYPCRAQVTNGGSLGDPFVYQWYDRYACKFELLCAWQSQIF